MAASEHVVAGVICVSDYPVGLVPTPLGVKVLTGWQLCPGDVLSSFHYPLSRLMVEGGAIAIQAVMQPVRILLMLKRLSLCIFYLYPKRFSDRLFKDEATLLSFKGQM